MPFIRYELFTKRFSLFLGRRTHVSRRQKYRSMTLAAGEKHTKILELVTIE